MKILIGSRNPVKVTAVKNSIQRVFPEYKEINIEGVDVSSDVSSQPLSDEETYKGAYNRACNASVIYTDFLYSFGIEGGLCKRGNDWEVFAYVVVIDKDGKVGWGRTSSFPLAKKMLDRVLEGIELGVVNDEFFNEKNSKQKGGVIGSLTRGMLGRSEYYEQAVLLSLIPFLNSDLYH